MNFIDAQVTQSGSDVLLVFGAHSIKVPEAKAKALIDGDYIDKTVVMVV